MCSVILIRFSVLNIFTAVRLEFLIFELLPFGEFFAQIGLAGMNQ
jgi:hypothetical protein